MDFMEVFEKARKETFRLELLDQYSVEDEKESFYAFMHGEEIKEDSGLSEWISGLDKLRRNDVLTRRVHVVSLPLTDYIRYELIGYAKTKENVNFISRSEYSKLQKPFEPKDFWLIDDKELFLVDYDKEGRWLGFKHITDKEQIAVHVKLKELLLKKAKPMSELVKQ